MKKRKLLYLFPVAALLLSGCSKEDVMFWKKKAEEEQQQSQEGGDQGGQQGGEQQGGEQGGQQGGGGEQQQNPIDFVGLALNDSTVTYDGQPHSLTVSGDLPEGATVSYGEAGNTFTAVGDHEVTATVSAEGYNTLTLTGTLHIVSAEFAGLSLEGATVTYDGQPHSLTVAGELPAGATVDYGTDGNTFTNAGTYEITATVHCEGYVDATFTATLTINKANFEGIVFEDAQVAYDGQPHTLAPQVPAAYEGAVVTYDEAGNEFTGSGLHVINATVSLANYNDWTGSAKLIIGAGPAASAKLEVIDFEGLSDNDLADEFDLKFYNNGWVTPQSFKVGIEKNQVFGTGTNTMKMTMTHQGAAFKATKDLGNAKTYNKYKGFAIDTMMDSRAEGGTMKLAVQFWFKDLPLPDAYAGYRNTYATYTLANNAPSIWTHWEIPFNDASLSIASNADITTAFLAAGYTVEEFSAYIDQVAIIITPNYKDGKNCYAYVDNLELTTGTEKVVEKHLVGGRYGADANGTYLDMNLSADLTSAEFFINGVSNATLTAEKAGTKVTFKDSAYAGAGLTVVADITDTGTLAISSVAGQAAAQYAMLNGLEFAKLAKLNYDLQGESSANHALADTNWKQEKYDGGWQNVTGQMNVRSYTADGKTNIYANMVTGYYMDYRYTYQNPVELGLANKFSVDIANDFSGCADIKIKVRLVEANGTEHYVAGDANNYQVVAANSGNRNSFDGWIHIEQSFDAINIKAVVVTVKSTRGASDYFYFDNLKVEYHVDYAYVPQGDLAGGARIKCVTPAGSDTPYTTELNVGGAGNGNFAGEGVYLRMKNNTGVDTPIRMKFNSTNGAGFGPKPDVAQTYYNASGLQTTGCAPRNWDNYLMLPANFDGFIYMNYETQMSRIFGDADFDPAHMWRVYIEYSGSYDSYADFEIGDIFTESTRVLDGSELDATAFAATWINAAGAVQSITQNEGGVVYKTLADGEYYIWNGNTDAYRLTISGSQTTGIFTKCGSTDKYNVTVAVNGNDVTIKDASYAGAGLTVNAVLTADNAMSVSSVSGAMAELFSGSLTGKPVKHGASVNLDFADGTNGNTYTNSHWKESHYTNSGWTDYATPTQMRAKEDKNGNKIVNFAAATTAYNFLYTPDLPTGPVNHLEVDLGNYYQNNTIRYKIALLGSDGNVAKYVAGDANNWASIAYDASEGNLCKTLSFDFGLVVAYKVRITVSTASGTGYMYMDNLKVSYQANAQYKVNCTSNWDISGDGAVFWAWVWGGHDSGHWEQLTLTSENNEQYFTVVLPETITGMKVVRFNPATAELPTQGKTTFNPASGDYTNADIWNESAEIVLSGNSGTVNFSL